MREWGCRHGLDVLGTRLALGRIALTATALGLRLLAARRAFAGGWRFGAGGSIVCSLRFAAAGLALSFALALTSVATAIVLSARRTLTTAALDTGLACIRLDQGRGGLGFRRGRGAEWRSLRRGRGREQALDPAEQTATRSGRRGNRSRGRHGLDGRLFCRLRGRGDRRRAFRGDAAHHGLLTRADFFLPAGDGGLFFEIVGHLVAGRQVVQARVVVLEPLELVVRRLQLLVGHQQHRHALAKFDLGDLGALFVEQERRDLDRHLHVHGGGPFLHRLFLDDAQDLQRARFRVADMAGAVAARAGDVSTFGQGRAQALARHLEQAELGDLAGLHARAVLAQAVAQPVFDRALILRFIHVDEVHHDQTAQVAQPHLARDFLGRLKVGAQRGVLDRVAARCPCRVDVDGDQRFGVVDHDRAARRQVHGA
ncbi:hypothetical protein GALL_362820 [mine drainage metagenome]|uniref:Uncharacterized protein n=1 Tax=mine drainage metagenome TaxID=410659 RepID=A0A1J5QEH0_9ZZZZ